MTEKRSGKSASGVKAPRPKVVRLKKRELEEARAEAAARPKEPVRKQTPALIHTPEDIIGDPLTLDPVGFQPGHTMTPQDEALFRAFQSNLLSLVSHELRTPLTGILNALQLLDQADPSSEFSAPELISMARRNAQRLNQTLASLLDLVAIESGTFHVRLRETDLDRLVRGRITANEPIFRDRDLHVRVQVDERRKRGSSPLLADPQKLGRALDLLFQLIAPRARPQSDVEVHVRVNGVDVLFLRDSGSDSEWENAWTQAVTGLESGVNSPASAFSGTVQSEQAFLTRMHEGLGNELLLIHQILRLHQGELKQTTVNGRLKLTIELPELSDEEGLRAVVSSRVYLSSSGIGSVALVLIRVPSDRSTELFHEQVEKCLFRASDSVYPLPGRKSLALVMDDCRLSDIPRLLKRMEVALGVALQTGWSHCPDETSDPEILITQAARRLDSSPAGSQTP